MHMSPLHIKPGWNFAFQGLAHFCGKSQGHPNFWREKKKTTKPSLFLCLNFNVYTYVDNRERARVREKNKGDQIHWKKNI